MSAERPEIDPPARIARDRERILARLGGAPLIMGILNVTPDSFSDGGRFHAENRALEHARRMAGDGTDMLDVGGESTRPGSAEVAADEEWRRIAPVLERIAGQIDVPVSVDSYKAATAERALARGWASFVNDVWGLQRDPDMAAVVARHGAGLIAMHNRESADGAVDIVADVVRFFDRTLRLARRAGIAERHIVLDPGIGFGKTFEQNLDILGNLEKFQTFGRPLLIGLSRKSFLGRILDAPVDQRLTGTLVANLWCATHGADILRVHDVAEHVAARKVLRRITGDGIGR